MRYCAAAETNFETLSKNSSAVFTSTVKERDAEGRPVKIDPPKATSHDYIMLALGAIIAAYDYRGEEPPVSPKDILFETIPEDINAMVTAVIDLRIKWYATPETIPENETDKQPDDEKNAETPATSSS